MNAEELMRLSVKDLRALAERHGVTGTSRLRKDQLVGALTAIITEAPAPAPALATPAPAGSSTLTAAAPAHIQQGPDPGLPIPERYDQDRLVLMVQDPHHIFAYWEVSPATYARIAGAAGHGASAVLVLHTAGGAEQREIDLRGGNYYLSVAANASFRAEIALRSRDGTLHLLAGSNTVQTPVAGPSTNVDAVWMEVEETTFHALLEKAGLPGADGSSLARLGLDVRTIEGRTLIDARALGLDETAARGLSSAELTRRAEKHIAAVLSSLALYSSTSLTSSALTSTTLSSRRP